MVVLVAATVPIVYVAQQISGSSASAYAPAGAPAALMCSTATNRPTTITECRQVVVKARSPEDVYTQDVDRTRRTVSFVLLAVLTGLPLSGSVCALVCAGTTQSASYHHHAAATPEASAADCPHSTTPEGPALVAVDGHDCSTHDGILRVAAELPTAARGDASVASISQDVVPAVAAPFSLTSLHIHWGDSSPSGTAPSSSFSLVLRI